MKIIPITVYLVQPGCGLSPTSWYVKTEPDGDMTYSGAELGDAVKVAVTAKFIKMAVDAMGEEQPAQR